MCDSDGNENSHTRAFVHNTAEEAIAQKIFVCLSSVARCMISSEPWEVSSCGSCASKFFHLVCEAFHHVTQQLR